MGKYKRSDRDYSREKQLSYENNNLKKEVARLRKQLARLNADSIDELKGTLESHSIDREPKNPKEIADKLKEDWHCTGTPGCEGYLEIIKFNKIDKEHYFRQCNSCRYRTRSQKWTDSVVGIIRKI